MAKKSNKILCVIPCFNEEETLAELIDVINKVKNDNKQSFSLDILLVNDGSSDNTQQVIKKLSSEFDYIFYRSFSHNAGHQSAIRAGLDVAANYDAVIMLDADLQHPPAYIPAMVKEWRETGASIVQMLRKDSHGDAGLFKYLSSRTYYWFLNKVSGLKLEYGSSDFRLIDQSVVNTIAHSPEKDLFLRGYFSWLKVKRSNIEYKPGERYAGASKYTLKKMMTLARRGVLQFSEKPLRIATSIGMIFAILSFLYGIYLVASYTFGSHTVSGWTSLMVVMLLCFGINFILIGYVGTYLAHSIELQKQRPDYIVAEEKLPTR